MFLQILKIIGGDSHNCYRSCLPLLASQGTRFHGFGAKWGKGHY